MSPELHLAEVAVPIPEADEVLVEVKAAGITPGEASIRSGALHEHFPAIFPSGQGSYFARVVIDTGPEVLGWSWTARATPTTSWCPRPECCPSSLP